MKAVVYKEYGGPEVLQLVDLPEPKFAQNSILVRVKAAGLNPADSVLQAGHGDGIMDAWFPVIPGWDVAGIVERVGSGVTEFSPGDEVIGYINEAILRHGTFAEQVASSVGYFARKPKNSSWEQAAALPLSGLTAYQAVVRHARVGSVETLLIYGAAGGVGSLAAQIALSLGVRVIGSATQRNHEYLKSIGVDPVPSDDGLFESVRRLVPNGVDAVLDTVGKGTLARTNALHGPRARVFSVADVGSGVATVYARHDSIDLMKLVELVETSKVVVRIGETFPLEAAAEAQIALRDRRFAGKIVLVVS
jgi:NADPH:quinone reductase-like Zn-dependent oxidoreductase